MFISFFAKKETNQRKMLDGMNSLRPPQWTSLKQHAAKKEFVAYASHSLNKYYS